jgi:CHAT domain-containing protein
MFIARVIVILASLSPGILGFHAHAIDNPGRWSTVSNWDDKVLTVGATVPRELARDEVHLYKVELSNEQCAEVSFNWDGLDLAVVIFDPGDKKLFAAPLVVTAPGPISIVIPAQMSGTYTLRVITTAKQKITGRYQIKLLDIRNVTARDQTTFAAQKLITEAQNQVSSPEVVKKYEQAIDLWRSIQDSNAEAQTLLQLGGTYRTLQMREEAKASYRKAIEIWHSVANPRGEAYARLNLGNVIRAYDSAKDALKELDESQKSFEQSGDKRGEAACLYSQAYAHMSIGQTPEAIDKLITALEIRKTQSDNLGIINVLNMLADANRIMGNFETSLGLYAQATEVLKGLEYPLLEANILNGTVLVYNDWGDWQRARDGYVSTLSSFESLLGTNGLNACTLKSTPQSAELCRSAANVLDNLAEAYNSLGNTDEAFRELAKSLLIRDTLSEPYGQGSTRFHVGYTHFLAGDLTNALNYYNAALPYQQKAGDDKGVALTYTYLGMAYVALKQPAKALDLYRQALPVEERSGDKRAQAITLDKMGQVYAILGNPNDSNNNFTRALALWKSVNDVDGEALTLYNMAGAHRAFGDLNQANRFSESAIKLIEALRTKITNQSLRTSYLADKVNYYALDVDLKMQLSKSEKHREYLAPALESNEKARARVLLESLNEAGVGRNTSPENSDPRFSLLIDEKLKLLSTLAAKAQVRTKLLNGPNSPELIARIEQELTELNAQYDELETKIRSQNRKFATLTRPTPASLAQIQQQLDDDTLLIEFLLGEPRSYAWVLGLGSIEGVELPASREIEDLAKRVSKAVSERGRTKANESEFAKQQRINTAEKDYDEASSLLSKAVLAPIAHLLTKKRLVVVADGALQFIPFEALPYPNQLASARTRWTQTVIEKHEVVTLPSASVLVLQRHELAGRHKAPYTLAVIADPVFGEKDSRVHAVKRSEKSARDNEKTVQASPPTNSTNGENGSHTNKASQLSRALGDVEIKSASEIPRLPFSLSEANAILRTVPASQSFSALNFNANRETVMNPKLSSYRIVHLATHGVMDLKHPELSGVLLSMVDKNGKEQNGYLGLNEIYNLNWPAELVVLSACETGIGKEIKGEGLIALTRGFMYAGAARVVASLWKVNDRATAELMAEFYRQMLINGTTPAAALRAAQLKLSHHPRWQNPHFWAGFVLQGEWR